MRVEVYRNLHNGKYSVKALEGKDKGRVVLHCDYVELTDVKFKVSQAIRARVLRERKKYVHATVQGTIGKFTGTQPKPKEYDKVKQGDWVCHFLKRDLRRFTYNPFKFSSFVDSYTESPIDSAFVAILSTENGTRYVKQ